MAFQSNFTCFKDANNEHVRLFFHCYNLEMNYPLYDSYKYSYLGVALLDFALAPIAAISNALVIVAIGMNKCLQTIPNCIIFSLALSDMFTGLFTQPIKGSIVLNIFNCNPNCKTHVTALQLSYSLGIVSFLSLSLITLERYIAIFYPYKYQELTVDKTLVIKIITGIWLLAATTTGLSFLTYQMILQRVFAIIVVVLSLIFSITAHVQIVRVVRRIRQEIAEQQNAMQDFNNQNVHGSKAKNTNGMATSKATRVATSVLLAMTICYIPSGVLTMLRFFGAANDFIRAIHDWSQSLVLLNSSINPFLYCLQLSEMRKYVCRLVWYRKDRAISTVSTRNTQSASGSTRPAEINV